ncbi:hypothetical protein [Sphaerisporangium fuscum]|uniref:hypothetical protein n=1 Tax=Sphaerisporangium fuscum TaxID=2835868 RepID=UPI001BDC92DA|nr:hypothetical protein [Sphaerisporangium fuscum]
MAGALPPRQRSHLPVVRQATSSWWLYDHDDESITTFMTWGRARAADEHRATLASDLIRQVTGLRHSQTGAAEWCDARGQARTLVALWLLGQVVPPELPRMRSFEICAGVYTEGPLPLNFWYGAAELGYARRMLAAPGTRDRLWAHWDTLTRPGTTLDQALPLLGLRPEFAPEPVRSRPCS